MEIINLERKNEYTNFLINLLAPILYDGINSIYNDGIKLCNKGDELKIFQSLLKSIPDWTSTILDDEINRIKVISKCEYLEDLIKAVIKSNISLLMNNKLIDKSLYDINLNQFIHNCYITIAKEFYQYPDLLYHNNKSLDIKRNQRESILLIKEGIKNSIRKMIPLNIILKDYLHDNNKIHDNETERNNMNKLLYNDMNNEMGNNMDNNMTKGGYKNEIQNNSITNSSLSNSNSKLKSKEPKLTSDKAIEEAYSNVRMHNSTNTNSIINNIKNNNSKVLSSNNNSHHIKTINNDTSMSYNIADNDNNYVTVYNN